MLSPDTTTGAAGGFRSTAKLLSESMNLCASADCSEKGTTITAVPATRITVIVANVRKVAALTIELLFLLLLT